MKKYFLFLGITLAATAPLALSANDDDNLTTEENQEVVLSNVTFRAVEFFMLDPISLGLYNHIRYNGTKKRYKY